MTAVASHIAIAWGPHAPELAANGLVLTAYRADDVETMLAMDRDPEVARRFGWAVEDAALWRCEAAIERFREAWRMGARAAFAVRESSAAPMLGTVEARREDDGRVELSWMTVPGQRGRGIASRAACAVRDWCFTTGADAVWAGVEHDNVPSLRVARSLGMSEHHRNGDTVHLVVRIRSVARGIATFG